MGPAEPEWLIWACRAKSKIEDLARQVQVINDAVSNISVLEQRFTELAATQQQVKTENSALRERILCLEQELNQQDQINAAKSQNQQSLEGKIETLSREFLSVINAVKDVQKTASIQKEAQKKELEEIRARVNAFTSHTETSTHARVEEISTQLMGNNTSQPPRFIRGLSQATTADESLHTDHQHNETQLLDMTQMHTWNPDTAQPAVAIPQIIMATQGFSTLEEYVKYGDQVLPESVKLYEAQAVKRFVNGMNDKYGQKLLSETLEKTGWTWGNAKGEILGRMQEGKTRKQRRRRIQTPIGGSR